MDRKKLVYIGIAVAAVLIVVIGGSLLIGGDKKPNETGNNTEVGTETEITEVISTETELSSESETSSEIETQVATNDSDVNQEATQPSNPVAPQQPTHTCNFATLQTDANNHWYACSCGKTANVGAHNYDDEYDASCNTCGYTRSVPQRPAPPAASTNPGNISWNGGNINLGSIGISVPTLEDFNSVGLVPGAGNEWTGAVNTDKKALSDMNVIYMNTEEFSKALEKQGVSANSVNGFTVYGGAIAWSWNTAESEAFKLERDRQNGYYKLIINMSLKDCPYGQYNLANWNKDIVKYLCTIVSSEPETLFNMIYEDIHGTTCISDTGWTVIGDCQIHYDNPNSYRNHYVYYIKAK